MSSVAIRMNSVPMKSLAFGDFDDGVFIALTDANGDPFFNEKVRILHLQNATDQGIIWSLNAVDISGFLPAGGFILLDVTTNAPQALGCYFSESQRLYVTNATVVPTSGSVFLSLFYAVD